MKYKDNEPCPACGNAENNAIKFVGRYTTERATGKDGVIVKRPSPDHSHINITCSRCGYAWQRDPLYMDERGA